MIDAALVALANLAVLAAVFVPLERVFAAREQRILRPALFVDACFFFGQYLVWSAASLACLRAVAAHVRPQVAIAHGWAPWSQVIVAVVLGDLVVYVFHRACHRYELLWRFHAVHHTSEHLDWVAAHREHPLDGVATALCMNLPAIALGVRMDLLAGIAVFRGMWAIFVHSNVRVPLGPLRVLLGAPELHHWHHARVERTQHNFANLAPWLDVLFGTYHCPEDERYALGIDEPAPKGWARLVVWPFAKGVRETGAAVRTSRTASGLPLP